MRNIWVCSDLHLWSRDNDSRHPFRSRHNLGKLSDQFAQDIQEDDLLIFLGDLCDPDVTDTAKLAAIVQRIPCRKLMCRGNHDLQDDAFYMEVGFDEVTEVIRLYNIIFSHKPIKVAADELNIHGHLHTEKLVTMGYNHINAYAANWNKDDHPVLLEDLLKSAIVQEHEYTPKELAHVTEKFEKYTSLENDQYTKILDISDWFPLCPVDEAVDIMPNTELAKIAAFCKWMDKTFQYGLRINGHWDPKRNTSSEDWDKYLVVQSPQEIEKSKVGVCWDFVSYEAWYFQKNFPGVDYKTYYIQFFNDDDCPSHTILTFELNGKHYYFECSFRKFAGLYVAKSEEDIINYVLKLMSDNPDPSIPKGELLRKWKYDAWEYDALDSALFGMHCQEYMNHVMGEGRCLYHNYKAPKGVKPLNLDVIHESRDILDEILFKDVDDTKYWLKDDKEYREQAEKGEQSDKSVAAIDETTNPNAKWDDRSFYYVCSENMDDDQLYAGKCIFPTVAEAAEYWAFGSPTPAGPGEYWVHSIVPGYNHITSSAEHFGAFWSMDNLSLDCRGKINIFVGPDGKRYMNWVFVYDDQGRAIYCSSVDESTSSRKKRLLHASFSDVKKIVDAIPKEEHHYFYHGTEFKDSSDVVYRKIIRERRRDGGSAFIDVYAFDDTPDVGVVVIAATPNGRGHGLTDTLINAACHELPAIGITRLVWRCDMDNKASYELAKRHEFIDVTKPGADQYRLERVISNSKISVSSVKELYHGSPQKYQTLKAQASPAYPDQPAVFATPMYDFALAFAGNPWSDLQINQCMHDGQHVLTEILPNQFDQCFNRPGYVHVLKPDGFAPFGRVSEWTCPTDVKPVRVKQVPNVLDELQKSGTVLYRYPDLPPWIPNRKKYMATIIKKYKMETTVDKLCEMYRINESAGVLDEMAYEDAADLMRRRLGHYCKEFNSSPQFEQIEKVWKKNWPGEKPPKLSPYMEVSSDSQLCLNLAHEINTDNDDGLRKVVTYTKIMHDLRKKLEKDKEIKDCAYIVGMYDLVEDGVLLYVNLKGIDAFSADSPEVYWPDVTAFEQPRENENDYVSHDGIKVVFENDKHVKIGEVSISGINTDEPYLYDLEVYSRYRGKNYGNAIMRYVMRKYKPTELCVEWKNEIAQKLYERFGFKKDATIADWHTTLIVMRTKRKHTGSFKSNEESISESVADTHQMDREQKADVAKKYGLQAVGDTHEAEEAEEKERKRKESEKAKLEKEKELERKREARNKALAKGRRTQKRNRIIKKVKSHLPGVKNEEADAVDGSDAAYIDDIYIEHDHSGDKIRFFDNPRNYADAALDESIHTYRFEMLEQIQFFDRIDESSSDEKTPSPVYVVLINGNSPVSAMIRRLTHAEFTHASISFDSSLTKMYSFAGKDLENKLQALIGGFKLENIKDKFYTENKIPYAVYIVPSTKGAVKRMKKRLDYFIQHETKFRFDYLGLVKNFFKIPDNPENTWFCSRFVADILNAGNPDKKLIDQPSLYRPEDFKSAGFAQFVDSGLAANYNKKIVDQKTKMILRAKKLDEGVLDVSLDNPWAHQVLNYQLTMMSEAVVDDFVTYLKSYKLRFDKDGNIVVTRREFDQLDIHFRSSLKTIKACETAGNVEGVKEELYKIHYMVELINQYYLRPDVKNMRPNAKDVRKDMLDLRSVMLNAFQQHLKYVTMRDQRWNFQAGYDASKYGKNITIPQKVITAIGKTVVTALA